MAMQDIFLSNLISALSLLPYPVTDMIWLLFSIVYLYVSTNNNMGHGVAEKFDNFVVALTGFIGHKVILFCSIVHIENSPTYWVRD